MTISKTELQTKLLGWTQITTWGETNDGIGPNDIIRPRMAPLLHLIKIVFLRIVEVQASAVISRQGLHNRRLDRSKVAAIVLD
jgi:hypothetical protein